ncbi:TetR family transcriptional regulator [Listeria weihenstephanensis FSL R9-0317]|uniref:TetR family transcriptional regulator n=1 Tax=Listeria weihenstephanensis TaxID=1006155 RepID=A0A1S7FTQ2_9LIST|nr:TetR/AcrR family transcriptional regulator [Listeria weihenstephanensis]AQY50749.1 TetR family transcriptional regulator [Listeria weihenstephanensis]EUJ38452.1 TetR family transcriptional regulator [Listeria weihenstephanensis FSL R9-0317]
MDDKRDKILKVAVEEFAEHGYKAASTNQICEVAGVSKGLIFHYFGSKEKLYTAAVEYSIDLAMVEVPVSDMPVGDFVQMAIWSTKQKLDFSKKYPAVFQLIMQSFASPPPEIAEKLASYYAELMNIQDIYVNQIFENITLRADVAYEDAHDVVVGLFEYTIKLATEYMQGHPDATMEEMQPLGDKFMNMMAIVERGMVEK